MGKDCERSFHNKAIANNSYLPQITKNLNDLANSDIPAGRLDVYLFNFK